MSEDHTALALHDATQVFPGRAGSKVVAVDGVSLELRSDPATITSLVGASGSGKSTIARMLLGLQRPTQGKVTYGGRDVFRLSGAEYDAYRRNVQPVFQDPYSIFNPFYRVDRVFWKAIKKFRLAPDKAAGLRMIEESLDAVRLDPGAVLGRYPHQLSGGQRQRLMLARVHMMRPSIVIADEPVSMLDVQIRKTFLDLLLDFHERYNITTLFITHDLSTVAYVGGQMKTLFQGRIVEEGPVDQVMTQPRHDYTRLLLASVPTPDPDRRWTDRIEIVDGTPRIVAPARPSDETADAQQQEKAPS
jgi:ABC-type oligopeptide transport system ATPase subunit